MYHLNNKQVMKKFQKIGIELAKGIAIVLAAYVLMTTVNPAYTGLKHAIANIFWGSRNLVGIIVSYSHPKFRPLPHGNKSIGGVGSHRASL